MKEKVRVRELSVDDILRLENLVLPAFQRNLKWKKAMQQDLVTSVMEGYPIGVFTLFNKDEKLYIIDGLQRFSTLTIFQRNPQNIFSWRQLKETLFFKPIYEAIIRGNNERKINMALRKWYEDDFGKNTFTNFKNEYINDCNLEEEIAEEIFFKIKNIFTNVSLTVPVIIYSGEWDEASDIFERMNTGSVNLSKYEVYAASWSEQIVDIPEKNKKYLEKKYIELENIIEIPEFDTTIFDLMLSMSYEYCEIEGIEKVFPNLKKKVGENGDIQFMREELGFEIISTLIDRNPLKIYSVANRIIENEGLNTYKELVLEYNELIKNVIYQIIEKGYVFDYYYEALFNIYIFIRCNDLISRGITNTENCTAIISELNKYSLANEWFTNENRQVTFLTNVINAFEEFVNHDNFNIDILPKYFNHYILIQEELI